MALEGVNRIKTDFQREILKPKIETRKTELQNTDNRNSVLGDRVSQGNLLKAKLNALFGGGTTQQTPKTTVDPVKKADELINAQGGKDSLNEDKAFEIGRQIGELSKTDPQGAIIVMKEVQNRLNDTNYGDNAASGFAANTTDADLDTIARTEGGADMLKNLQDHLLSGSVHSDEIKEAQRFGNAVTNAKGIFTDNGDGVQPGTEYYVSPYSQDATPEQAAAFLKYDSALSSPEAPSTAFAEALEIHKNDPEWVKNFMSAVGTKKVAEYISGIYSMPNSSKENVARYSDTIRTTLENLVSSGALQKEGMDNLVNQLKDREPYVFTEIFGKSGNVQFREMFVRSAIANGNDKLDAAASQVLAGMSTDKQAEILSELDKNGKLSDFVKGAMAGQQTVVDLNYKLDNPNYSYADAPKTTVGGITKILQNAGIQAGYNGSTFQNAPYSQDLQQKLFYAAAKGLTDSTAAQNFKSDVAFKDALSTVFLQHSDDIFKNSISENGSSLTGDTQWLGKFFQNTMFSQPPSTKSSDVMATVYSKVAGIAKATDLIRSGKSPLTAEEQALVDNYYKSSPKGQGWQTGQAAGVVGEWLGNLDRAYTNAVKEIGDDAAGNKALLETFIGAVDKLTGLAKLTPGASIAKDLLVDQLNKLPGYIEGKQVENGKAKISDSAKLITDLNNLIWDTIYYQDKNAYGDSFRFVAGHLPTENGVG